MKAAGPVRPRQRFQQWCTAFLLAGSLAGPSSSQAQIVHREADEADLNERRQEWMERIHRVAPGVDWRELESANRLEAQFLRQAFPAPSELSPWQEKGASNLTGRNWVSAVAPNQTTVYIGSANGGLFRRTGSVGPWSPLTDNVGYGVHHLAYVPGSPERFLISSTDGRMFASTDGGATWSIPSGLPEVVLSTVRVVQEANQPLTIYVLVQAAIWNGSGWDQRYYLLRSLDGGATLAVVHSEPLDNGPDLWIDRTAAGPLYMSVGNQLKRSIDHGLTFTVVGTFPQSGSSARLAGSEGGAPHLYCALFTETGWRLYGSADAGVTWGFLTTINDFYGTLLAPVTDPNQVLYGGVNCYRSTNGGVTFSPINEWWEYYANPDTKLHADIFGLNSHFLPPAGAGGGAGGEALAETILIHTDGGTYTLAPAAAVPHNLTRFNFPNAQYYGTLTTTTDPNIIFAGSQDQGYQISHPGLGTITPQFTQVISGDYAHLTSAWPDKSRMVYSVYPGFVLVQTGPGDAAGLELNNFPVGAQGFQFLPAITADPDDTAVAYVGAKQVWRMRRLGPSSYEWTALPYDFGGNSNDVVGAIAIAPSDHSRWYVATYGGSLFRSTDHGLNWTPSAITGPPSHYFSGSDLVVAPEDPQTAYVCGSGYSNPGVFKTTDGGVTWTAMGAGLPPTQVFALAFDNGSTQNLYAATQAGAFRFNPGTQAWVNLLTTTCCAPLTDYWDVESVPSAGVMRFSTYGRGIWDYNPTASIAVPDSATGASPAGLRVTIAPNPAAARSTLEFALGSPQSVEIALYDVKGRRLRTLASGMQAAGAHRIAFDLRADSGRKLASGLYLLRVVTSRTTTVRRLTVVN
jgi:photosystem II stability/assembly factor-like uncharacterized protein